VLRTWEKELDGGANVDAVIDPKTQDTRLHKAVTWRHWAVVRSLLIAGASVDRRNAEGLTPLHIAAKMAANQEIIALLLAAGGDPNLKTPDGTSGFLLAVPHLLSVTKMLLRAGADVNQRGPDGATALIKACGLNRPLSVRLLADNGADINIRDNSGRTALEYAREYPDGLAAKTLIERGAKVDIFTAAALGLVEEARSLLKQNPALANANDRDGWTPLHHAATTGRCETAELLIGAGAKVNAKTRFGGTALDCATAEKKTEMADLLRKHGARSGRPR
jgi:ankyrin repeat protein